MGFVYVFESTTIIFFNLPVLLIISCNSVTELIIAVRRSELVNQLSASTQRIPSLLCPVKENCREQ